MKGARGGDHPQLTCQGKNNNCRHVEGEVGNGLLERRAGVGEVNHVGSLQDCLKGLWKSTCASALQFGRSACDFISTITKKNDSEKRKLRLSDENVVLPTIHRYSEGL